MAVPVVPRGNGSAAPAAAVAAVAETVRWNVPAPAPAAAATATALAPAPRVPRTLPDEPAAVELSPPPRPARRRPRLTTARQEDPTPEPQAQPEPAAGETHVVLEGTAAPLPSPPRRTRPRNLPADPAEMGHILLVEDDQTIAGMYAMLLRTRGYTTRHARDGVEGISMVREELPALILLDMMMPRMDGLQFLHTLRGWPRTADLPVVILSNVSDRHLVDKAMELGCIEYLVKAQTRPQVLLGALPHWLRGNRALTTLQ
jgi:CheY-like chemotaxis protein